MNDQWAVITGASSGIGAEFARQLSMEGYSVLLVGRRAERLAEVQKNLTTESEILVCDLALPEDRNALKARMQQKSLGILINNAGFGACGSFTENAEQATRMIHVNIEAVHDLTATACMIMEKQGNGRILNIASVAGLLPCGPYMTDYYATKAYVASMTNGLAEELRRKNSPVRVFCLCPGPVNTEFNQVANVQFSLPGISPETCVQQALRGMKHGKTIIIPSFIVRAGVFLQRFLPRKTVTFFIARSQKRKMQR